MSETVYGYTPVNGERVWTYMSAGLHEQELAVSESYRFNSAPVTGGRLASRSSTRDQVDRLESVGLW